MIPSWWLGTVGIAGLVAAGLAAAQELERSPGQTAYYVDAAAGDDAADGRAPERAWRSLAHAGSREFAPGDRLLLKSRSRFTGSLELRGSGSEQAPIRVSRYGEGPLPILAGDGVPDSVLTIRNGSFWEVSDLEICNTLPDGQRRDNLRGVAILADGGGVFRHIVLRGLHIRDVSGGWDRHGGHGIWLRAYGDSDRYGTRKSCFDGVLIEDCYIHDVSFYGIMLTGWENRLRDETRYPSRNVVVRNNLVHDTGGDAIVLLNCDGPLFEHNEAHRCCVGQTKGGKTAAAGIWPHSCDRAVLRFNKVVGNLGVHDGEAFDVDNNCRDALLEYNVSQGNPGGFLLICSGPDEPTPPTRGVTARFNLSLNDGINRWGRVVCTAGTVRDILLENNAFVTAGEADVAFLSPYDYGRDLHAANVRFRANVFSTGGTFRFRGEKLENLVFAGNLYAGEMADAPPDADGVRAAHPAVDIRDGSISLREGTPRPDVAFAEFTVSKAGLLPESRWLKERDASLARSIPAP